MKWNGYGIIILILSLVLTTSIEARGGGRGGGGRSSGGRSSGGSRSSSGSHSSSSGSHSSSSGSHSSSSGSHSSSSGSGFHSSGSGSHGSSSGIHSSGSYNSGSHTGIGGYGSHGTSSSGFDSNGNHANSQGSWNSVYGSSISGTKSSPSHTSSTDLFQYTPSTHTINYNWDPMYQHKQSRPSTGSNDFMHGFMAGNVISHNLSPHRTPSYHYGDNWRSHTGHSDDTPYENPYSSEPVDVNAFMDSLNALNNPTPDMESVNDLYKQIAKMEEELQQATNGVVGIKVDSARSHATPESATTTMRPTSTISTDEFADFLNELSKPMDVESMNALLEKMAIMNVSQEQTVNDAGKPETFHKSPFKSIAQFDLGKALHTNIFEKTTVSAAGAEATTEFPINMANTSKEPPQNILNAKLKSMAQNPSNTVLDIEMSKFLNVLLSQPTFEKGKICKPVIYETKNEFGVNVIIEQHECHSGSEVVAPEE